VIEWTAWYREAEFDYFAAAAELEAIPEETAGRDELVGIVRRLQSRWETRMVAFTAFVEWTQRQVSL
jgi:hypothetical protein